MNKWNKFAFKGIFKTRVDVKRKQLMYVILMIIFLFMSEENRTIV